jgi:hypothetical protein
MAAIAVALRDEDTDQAGDEVGRHCEAHCGLDEPDSDCACGCDRAEGHPFTRHRRLCLEPRGETHRALGTLQQRGTQHAPRRSQSRGWAKYGNFGSELQYLQHGNHLFFNASPWSRMATRGGLWPLVEGNQDFRRTARQSWGKRRAGSERKPTAHGVGITMVQYGFHGQKLSFPPHRCGEFHFDVGLKSKRPGCIAATRAA